MKHYSYLYLQEWILTRPTRERILYLILGCLIIYLLWFLIFSRPLFLTRQKIHTNILKYKAEIQTANTQSQLIRKIESDDAFSKKRNLHENLISQAVDLKKQTENIVSDIFIEDTVVDALNYFINQTTEVKVLSLKKIQDEPLITSKYDAINVSPALKEINKQLMMIELEGSYFKIVDFLNKLQNVYRFLLFDSLEYKVINYPTAHVVIKFYVLIKSGKTQ